MVNKTPILLCLLLCLPSGVEAQDLEEILRKTLKSEKPLATLAPSWMDVSIQHRTRYETYNHSFQNGIAGSTQQVAQRTRIVLGIKDILDPIRLTVELADFRTPVADRGQESNPVFADHWDLFQLHAGAATHNFLGTGISSRLEVGRLVMDFAKGRLIAGHRFGSFTPSFDGIQWFVGRPETVLVRAFATRPVQRHSVSPDSSVPVSYFWGLDLLSQANPALLTEAYYFGLSEDDVLRYRKLSTLGFRVFAEPSKGHMDYEIDSMYQF